MKSTSIKSMIVAGSLAAGLLSTTVAASAHTTAAAPATTQNTAIATTTPLMPNPSSVSVATVTHQSSKKDRIQKQSDEARRVEFRNLGTSL